MKAGATVLLVCAATGTLFGCAGGSHQTAASMRIRGVTEQLTARVEAACAEADETDREERLSRIYASWQELPFLLAQVYTVERRDGATPAVEALSHRINEAVESPPPCAHVPAWALADGTVPAGNGLHESRVAADYRWRLRQMFPACFDE